MTDYGKVIDVVIAVLRLVRDHLDSTNDKD